MKALWLLNKRDLLLTFLVLCFLSLFYGGSLWMLLSGSVNAQDNDFIHLFLTTIHDEYIRHIIIFSFFQAFLSAVLSIFFGLMAAHALYYQEFTGKRWLVKLFSLSMVLPVLVAIFGLLGVYGQAGWIANICQRVHITCQPNIYGLSGILIAHIFFNLPLSAKVFLNTLHSIPSQHRKLADQLGLSTHSSHWNFLRWVEYPYLRQAIPSLFVLVFMLCFTSFTIVLTLGGSPKYTTLEVAIYQSIVFNFELQLGAIIALLQFLFCFGLFFLSNYLTRSTETAKYHGELYKLTLPRHWTWSHWCILVFVIAFICLPLLNIVVSSFDVSAWQNALQNPSLYKAMAFSLSISTCAGILCVLMTVLLLLGARQLNYSGFNKLANHIVNAGMMILAIPTLVLAVGLFLWLRSMDVGTLTLFAIVVLCNALMAMPFALRILIQPFYNNMTYYERLCQSLGIGGFDRFKLIEWQAMRKPMLSALALTIALSLGDFTAIALFGNQDFTSLPHLLYQQLGNYRTGEASITAFVLLLLTAMIFLFIEADD